jgi:hypothetical protein
MSAGTIVAVKASVSTDEPGSVTGAVRWASNVFEALSAKKIVVCVVRVNPVALPFAIEHLKAAGCVGMRWRGARYPAYAHAGGGAKVTPATPLAVPARLWN